MELIEHGFYYHVYNRGINSQTIFKDDEDCRYFLKLISIYIDSIAEIFAFALMGNHFHFFIRVKEDREIGYLHLKYDKSRNLGLKWKTTICQSEEEKALLGLSDKPVPEKMFQHLFSTYALYFNKKYNRTGALFEHPFRRIRVENESYLKRLILYIHCNPVKHGICKYPQDYFWTSYLSIISNRPTKISRDTVIEWFENVGNFKVAHMEYNAFDEADDLWLEE